MPLILDGTTGASLIATTAIPASVVLSTPASGVLTNCTGAVVAALSTASGSAPSYSARAWVNFVDSGTAAINASANISSVSDIGTGNYVVNFTTAMPDANYVGSISAQPVAAWNQFAHLLTNATGSIGIYMIDTNSNFFNAVNPVKVIILR